MRCPEPQQDRSVAFDRGAQGLHAAVVHIENLGEAYVFADRERIGVGGSSRARGGSLGGIRGGGAA